MSEATEKLARSRQALLQVMARRQRKHDPQEEFVPEMADAYGFPLEEEEEPEAPGSGWFGHLRHAVRTWWRYHPAHMAVDLATPVMRSYARRKPMQLLAISAAAGAALTFARPWRLVSIGTLAIALLKSSQLSHLVLAALSAADYRKDADRPGAP
jgi:hypothetical protein